MKGSDLEGRVNGDEQRFRNGVRNFQKGDKVIAILENNIYQGVIYSVDRKRGEEVAIRTHDMVIDEFGRSKDMLFCPLKGSGKYLFFKEEPIHLYTKIQNNNTLLISQKATKLTRNAPKYLYVKQILSNLWHGAYITKINSWIHSSSLMGKLKKMSSMK